MGSSKQRQELGTSVRKEGRGLSCSGPVWSSSRWKANLTRERFLGDGAQRIQSFRLVPKALESRSVNGADSLAPLPEARTHRWRVSATCQPYRAFRTGSGASHPGGNTWACRHRRLQKPPEQSTTSRAPKARRWRGSAAYLTKRSIFIRAWQTGSASTRGFRARLRRTSLDRRTKP